MPSNRSVSDAPITQFINCRILKEHTLQRYEGVGPNEVYGTLAGDVNVRMASSLLEFSIESDDDVHLCLFPVSSLKAE